MRSWLRVCAGAGPRSALSRDRQPATNPAPPPPTSAPLRLPQPAGASPAECVPAAPQMPAGPRQRSHGAEHENQHVRQSPSQEAQKRPHPQPRDERKAGACCDEPTGVNNSLPTLNGTSNFCPAVWWMFMPGASGAVARRSRGRYMLGKSGKAAMQQLVAARSRWCRDPTGPLIFWY